MKLNLASILASAHTTSTGACVVSVEDLPAESAATWHSLNSREPGGWRANLGKLFDEGTGTLILRILKTFYVGYGHKSIGDCGSADVAVDDCSLLAANHFEHHPLFGGQETSTRYVDLSGKSLVQTGIDKIDSWALAWFAFYKEHLPTVIEAVRILNPHSEGEIDKWEKATKSRACDIMAAFLPGATRTNFSIHMNLRQLADHLGLLVHHPMPEMSEIAEGLIAQLQSTHPNSFKFREKKPELAEYSLALAKWIFGTEMENAENDEWEFETTINTRMLEAFFGNLLSRPPKAELPQESRQLGSINIHSQIDWRSFRDIHRQRSASFKIPILSPSIGFEGWYLEQIPNAVRVAAEDLIAAFTEAALSDESHSSLLWQYATPMGFKVNCDVSMPLDAALYIAELRTGIAVHPTARMWSHKLAAGLAETFPDLQLHIDYSPDQFVLKRGDHDIVKR